MSLLRVQLFVAFLCAATCLSAQPQPAPLTGKELTQNYLKSLISPSSILSNVLIAGYEEARNFPHEWGRTGRGFEKRLGSQFAEFGIDKTIELGFSAIHHEDNRYVRLGDGGFWRRFGNVAKSPVVVADSRGGQTVALGQIAGAYGSWAIASQVWEPPSEQRVSRIFLWGSVNLAAKGGFNFLKEFGPHKKTPPQPHP